MKRECLLPPIKKLTTTTDPVVKVSWGSENRGLTSGEAVEAEGEWRLSGG
jgi:hypothetical protein